MLIRNFLGVQETVYQIFVVMKVERPVFDTGGKVVVGIDVGIEYVVFGHDRVEVFCGGLEGGEVLVRLFYCGD